MDIQKAIELLDARESMGILLPEEPSFDCLCAAEALLSVLRDRGKQAGLMQSADAAKNINPEIHRIIQEKSKLPKDYIISLNTKNAPVSRLRYEKKEDSLDIILSPASRMPVAEDISMREGEARLDCAISLENPALDSARARAGEHGKAPVINIGTDASNTLYGDAVCINSESSLSEIAASILSSWESGTIPPDAATALLAGIFSHMEKKPLPPRASALSHAAKLLSQGADYERAAKSSRAAEEPPNVLRLFGRGLTRSRHNPEQSIFLSFLTAEDFEKTETTEKDIFSILARIEKELGDVDARALVWQNPRTKEIRVLLSASDARLRAIHAAIPSSWERSRLAITHAYPSFQEAEYALSALLEKGL